MLEPTEMSLTLSDGSTRVFRRCGVLPDVFTSRDGDIIQLNLLQPFNSQGHSCVRYRGRSTSSRHLVADAWRPDWDSKFRAVTLRDKSNVMDVAIDNLEFQTDARRGRPRSEELQRTVQLARIGVQMGDLTEAADEAGCSDQEMLEAVLSWFPEALVTMEGVPEHFSESKLGTDLKTRAQAVERRRQLRLAQRRAERAKLDGKTPEERDGA